MLVKDGHGKSGHQDIAASFVDIRFGPEAIALVEGHLEPFLIGVVVIFGCEGLAEQFMAGTEGIRCIERVFLAVSRHQGHGRTDDDRIVLDQQFRHPVKAVRNIQAPAGNPHVVPYGGFRLVDDVQNLVFRGIQFAFSPLDGLLPETSLREEELDDGRRFQRKRCNDNQQQSGPRRFAGHGIG